MIVVRDVACTLVVGLGVVVYVVLIVVVVLVVAGVMDGGVVSVEAGGSDAGIRVVVGVMPIGWPLNPS